MQVLTRPSPGIHTRLEERLNDCSRRPCALPRRFRTTIEVEAQSDPVVQGAFGPDGVCAHENETAVRSPLHPYCSDAFPLDGRIVPIRIDPAHQATVANGDAHLPAHHEADPAEHFPLGHTRVTPQDLSHPLSQDLVAGHRRASVTPHLA